MMPAKQEEEGEEEDEGDHRIDADPGDRVHVVFDELQHGTKDQWMLLAVASSGASLISVPTRCR
jgi:hypothetical protein